MAKFKHDQKVLVLFHSYYLGESRVWSGFVDLGGSHESVVDAGGPTVPVVFLPERNRRDVPRDEVVPYTKADEEAMLRIAKGLNSRTIAAWEAAKDAAEAEVRALSGKRAPGG